MPQPQMFQSLLRFRLQLLPMGCSNSLQKPTWRTRIRLCLLLQSKQSFKSNSLRPGSSTSIMASLTWTATAFLNSVRTTLKLPEPMGPITSLLPPRFCAVWWPNDGISINVAPRRRLQSLGRNSRVSSGQTLETTELLQTVSAANLGGILSTKLSSSWIGPLTSSTYGPFC